MKKTRKAICELKNIKVDFTMPGGNTLNVFEKLNLSLYPNEVVAVLGPSGCGKSTLLRVISGLMTPTKGCVNYAKEAFGSSNSAVSVVFQSFALYPWMTVLENVENVLKAKGLSKEDVHEKAISAIRAVSLAGFEEAYPRELSGGMKQRVGMARALSVEPLLLCMDEPFSQVDALTAESLRAEILDIWTCDKRNPSTIFMVSHDIKEVVYMADRIVILSPCPGYVRQIIENPLARPRDYRSKQFLQLVDHINDIITNVIIPDEDTTADIHKSIDDDDIFESLPAVGVNKIIGLLEVLDANGGKEDIFRIASYSNQEFDLLINIVKAAELLEFVETPKRKIFFTETGRKFINSEVDVRKEIWKNQLLTLTIFKHIFKLLQDSSRGRTSREEIEEEIAIHLPYENPEKMFSLLANWARFGELFAYSEDTDVISLD